MMKEQMIKDMTVKVTDVLDARNVVDEFADALEEAKASGQEAVEQLEAELQKKKEALPLAQDLGEAKLIKQEIDSLTDDIELQKAVNAAKVTKMKAELEDKVEAFFKVHKSAKFMFQGIDNYIVVNTSLSELTETKELMRGFINALDGSFAGVRQVLLDEGIVSFENQNKVYKGIHLGQRGLETKLYELEYRIKPFINELRAYGLEIK